MKFILFTDQGFSLYNGDFNSVVPPGAIPIADEQYARICYDQRGRWALSDGEVVMLPPPPVDTTPRSCTRRQGRLALLASGLLDDVEAALVGHREYAIEYEASTWERANPVIQEIWSSLGGTPEQLADLFTLAVTL